MDRREVSNAANDVRYEPHDDNRGEPARVVNGVEIIGPPECPIMARRTLFSHRLGKLLLHEFFPGASDEAHHDHPRSFWTFVYAGGYDDIQPDGTTDHVYAPALRFRRAEHAHITRVGPEGAKTVVLMGPLRREWGFYRDGKWFPWRTFERLFGLNWRCPE